MSKKRNPTVEAILFLVLLIICILFLVPIFIVLINSFKSRFFISSSPFSLPQAKTYVGMKNYVNGVEKIDFFSAFRYSLFITVFSVLAIDLVTSMLGWYLTRVKTKFTSVMYLLLVTSMIVPFQMVMFTMSKTANMLHLDNPVGIIVLYVGFGAGLSTFMFSGFIKSVPLALEEAAMIDGATPIVTFFQIVLPMLKPTAITVSILNTMWVWNDYLLPYLTIGTDYKTIPIAIQYLRGGYGSVDMGAMMAMLILAMIPVIFFYFFSQKFIIEGVIAGAVKG
ncbi:MAG: carbohydrate ABC transporter permease [Spirochaetia bacterium]|jgi:raffinose/stachyose/melibiose transport system permease protein|nr:carbohydrate ABC transporter permease [Spirochaetia bacterium]